MGLGRGASPRSLPKASISTTQTTAGSAKEPPQGQLDVVLIKRASRDSWRTHARGAVTCPRPLGPTWPLRPAVEPGALSQATPILPTTGGSLSPGPGWPPTSSRLQWRAPPICPPRPTRRGFLGRPPRPLSWLRWGLPGPGRRLKRCRGGREGRERSVEAQRGERGPGPAALARRQPVKVPVPRKMGAGASPPEVDGGRTPWDPRLPGAQLPWLLFTAGPALSPVSATSVGPVLTTGKVGRGGSAGQAEDRGTEAQQVGPVHRVKG